MQAGTLSVVLGVSAPLVVAGAAQAHFVGIKTVVKQEALPLGLFVCNVYAVFDRPGDVMQAVAGTSDAPLDIFVKQGKFYQHPQGAPLTAPPLQFLPGDPPTLAYDTFITIGVKQDDLFSTLDDIFVTPGVAFGNSSLQTSNGGWGVPPDQTNGVPDANGQVLIFQGSFIIDGVAQGIAGTFLVQFKEEGIASQAVVSFDQQIPAPGGAALLAVAGLWRRRRRRRLADGNGAGCFERAYSSSDATAATSATSPGRTDAASNFFADTAMRVIAAPMGIGGLSSPFFMRWNRTGLIRATTNVRR